MISVLICTKNEEENIKRAILSVRDLVNEVGGEIIVLDSGSTDRTVYIAEALGARTYFRPWTNYADQRNYGITLCKGPWILIIDADEELSKELARNILNELKNPKYDVYKICRKVFYLGKFLNHTWYPEWRIRLFKKGLVKFYGSIHEGVNYSGKIGFIKGDLYHYSFKSISHHIEKSIYYAKLFAEIEAKKLKSVKLLKLVGSPLVYFIKFYFLKKGFLDGKRGLIASVISSFYAFMKYAFLYEKNQLDRHFQHNENKEDIKEEGHPNIE